MAYSLETAEIMKEFFSQSKLYAPLNWGAKTPKIAYSQGFVRLTPHLPKKLIVNSQ